MNLDNNFLSWKKVIIILIIGIGIWILIPKLIGLKQTLELLKQVKYWAFFLALFAESFFYIGSTILTKAVLGMTGDKLKFKEVLQISLLDSFSVQFLPFGSLGEGTVSYFFYKEKKIRTSHIILMFIARTIILYLVFAAIYLIGVAFSPTNHSLSPNALIVIWFAYLAAFAGFFYLISLYFRKSVLIQRAAQIAKIINKITRILHIGLIPLSHFPEAVQKFYDALKMLAKNRHLQINAALGAVLFWAGDILCLYFSLLGFGYRAHLPIVIFAYSAAKILALITFIPGGLGIVEGSLALIFIGFGVPASTALAAVLIFRFISFWIPVPIGLASFIHLRRNDIKTNLEKIISIG